MKILKFKIMARIRDAVTNGVSFEEASFNARQWARRMRARERLAEAKNPAPEIIKEEELQPSPQVKNDTQEIPKSPRPRGRSAKGTPS